MAKTRFDERGGADNLIYGECDGDEIVLMADVLGKLVVSMDQHYNALLKEMRIMNLHLAMITGASFELADVEGH